MTACATPTSASAPCTETRKRLAGARSAVIWPRSLSGEEGLVALVGGVEGDSRAALPDLIAVPKRTGQPCQVFPTRRLLQLLDPHVAKLYPAVITVEADVPLV